MIDWNRFGPTATDGQIEELEKILRMRLPIRYRNFLLSTNGGQPRDYVGFVVADISEKVMLGCLYAIYDDKSRVDLRTVYCDLRDEAPEGFMPIGEDPGGNQLLLAINGVNNEGIYFWDRVGLFSSRTGTKVFRVAKDIDEFLKKLVLESDH